MKDKKSIQVYREDWAMLTHILVRDGDRSLADTVKKLLKGEA